MHQPSALPVDLVAFIDTTRWTFARTMPEWPHEYIVRDQVDEQLFIRLVQHIRQHGYQGAFYHQILTYFDDRGWTFWTMGAPLEETTIINRCRREDTYEYNMRNRLSNKPGK